jgi:ligand-binding sensor domain-containing protein
MYCKKIISGFFCLLLFYMATAQPADLIFKHLTKSSGLPVETITCLAQDSSGFIWMGSNEGLFRYDGFNFKEYHFNPGNKNSIPGNAISKVCVTRKGFLWIATLEGGIACLDPDGKVIRIINSSNTSLFTKESDWVNDIKEDKYGNMWWTTTDGLFRLLAKNGEISCYKLGTSLIRDNAFTHFVFDASGKLWVSSLARGLMIFDPSTKSFTHVSKEPYKYEAFQNKHTFSTIALHKGKLWYSTWWPDVGVYDTARKIDDILYDGRKFSLPDFSRMVNTFYIDSKNNLW